jgi:hypothetical protein
MIENFVHRSDVGETTHRSACHRPQDLQFIDSLIAENPSSPGGGGCESEVSNCTAMFEPRVLMGR